MLFKRKAIEDTLLPKWPYSQKLVAIDSFSFFQKKSTYQKISAFQKKGD
jgi:hypothetical protein